MGHEKNVIYLKLVNNPFKDSPCLAPNAYSVTVEKDSPAYSLASRAKELKPFATPAPGSYEVGIVPVNYLHHVYIDIFTCN